MSANIVVLNGRLPKFDANYTKGEGDKKSFLSWCISVKRDFKKADEQYYPEDLIKFKAFGPKADFIMNQFAQGDGLIIMGKLQVEENYKDKTGAEVKGGLVVMVDSANFADSKAGDSKPAGATTSKPGIPQGKPGLPGAASKPGLPGMSGAKPGIPGAKPNFSAGRPTPPGIQR